MKKTPKNPAPPAFAVSRADEGEIARFSALAETWWNPQGPMAPLHKLNPVRLSYITQKIIAHFGKTAGVSVLDIGCGAGLVAENIAMTGAEVTGIDASEKLIAAATQHAKENGVDVTYKVAETAAMIKAQKKYDVVMALEIIEHVDAQKEFVREVSQLVKQGGLVFFSTLNRSPKGFLLGIVGAEFVMRWLPVGTHDWRKFVKPSELTGWMEDAGLAVEDVTGLAYNPMTGSFSINPRDVNVNYYVVGRA